MYVRGFFFFFFRYQIPTAEEPTQRSGVRLAGPCSTPPAAAPITRYEQPCHTIFDHTIFHDTIRRTGFYHGRYELPCHTIFHRTIFHDTKRRTVTMDGASIHAIPYFHHTIFHDTIRRTGTMDVTINHAIPYFTIPYSMILYIRRIGIMGGTSNHAIPYFTIPCSIMLYAAPVPWTCQLLLTLLCI